jgi:adenylosuccinate synthase
MSLWVVVGGQYGSEGKGKVAAYITRQENIDICVRCGGPNSGHSFVDEKGSTIILRQLPTGFVNSHTRLLIPAGGLIDPLVLKNEIKALAIPPERIGIDPKCIIITEEDQERENRLRLRERLSSTLCGVGVAVSRRVLRGDDAKLVRDVVGEYPWLEAMIVENGVSSEVNTALDLGERVLIEGTQGFGLSLYHSEHYPHATSRDTTASGFLSEVGLSPRLVTEIVVVLRTFPIRVAGQQAGPLKHELTWEQIQFESGYPFEIEERTSVSNKVRRVGRFDWDLVRDAIRLNRPTRIAVNGLDYLDYRNFGLTRTESLSERAVGFVRELNRQLGTPIIYLGVGPSLHHIIEQETTEASTSRETSGIAYFNQS